MKIPLLLELLPYILLAAGMAACLVLFVSGKRDARQAASGALERCAALEQDLAAVRRALEQMGREMGKKLEAAAQPAAALPPGLNQSRRANVLRLARRGEGPDTIAAALGCPRNEVVLLLKLEKAAAAAPGSAA